jgi:hypothetical protein
MNNTTEGECYNEIERKTSESKDRERNKKERGRGMEEIHGIWKEKED